MEKFSLYDLLGLLLPGVLFLHFLGILNNLFVKANIAFPDTGLDLGIIFTSLNSCLLADRLREQGYMRNNVLDLFLFNQ